MQCQICGDENGPFEFADYKKRVVLACEDCAKKIRKDRKNDATNLFNKRPTRGVSRSNSRSK